MTPSREYVLDTNILVRFHDGRDEALYRAARDILQRLHATRAGALPAQVLAEYSNVMLRRARPGIESATVYAQVADFAAIFPVLPLTEEIVLEAIRGVREYKFSYYDAQIWAAARLSGATVVLSEDFNTGATIEGVTFVNPFAPDAPPVL